MSSKPKILLVDDEKSFNNALRNQLSAYCNVFQEKTNKVIFSIKNLNLNYDLILLNLELNKSNSTGSGLIKQIKKIQPDTPIIVITKSKETTNLVEIMKLGVEDIFSNENFNIEEWKKKIDSYLKQPVSPTATKPQILLVDDEKLFFDKLYRQLHSFYVLEYAPSEIEAEKSMQINQEYNLILLDLILDENKSAKDGGLRLIKIIQQYKPDIPIIIVTKYNETANLVEAMKLGAVDFLWKEEYNIEEWKKKMDAYIKSPTKKKSKTIVQGKPFIGKSRAIQQIKDILVKLSGKPDVTILITGETGVGKEVAAQYLHTHGMRSDQPFKAVNLSTVTKEIMESRLFGHRKGAFTDAREDKKGIFEQADGGILFLDEIGEIDLKLQVKLLRFLQEKVITPIAGEDVLLDVQIVAATNKDLREEVLAGKFREDLFYRLNQFHIEIPPLRKRRDDLELLLEYYLRQEGVSEAILSDNVKRNLLKEYTWPGNIRELVNWVKSACLKRELLDLPLIDESLLPNNALEKKKAPNLTLIGKQEESLFNQEDWQAKAAFEELKPIEIALKKHGKKSLVGDELNLSLDQLRYKVNKHYENHPDIFEDFPEIKKKYKLS